MIALPSSFAGAFQDSVADPTPRMAERPVGVGGGPTVYVNWSPLTIAEVPPGVVTVTSTSPGPPTAGEVAVIEVSELTVKLAAAVEPKATEVAPLNSDPVTVTVVPPLTGPEVGATELIVGTGGGDGGAGRPSGPSKAWTAFEEGASTRPSAADGEGKSEEVEPIEKLCRALPFVGSSP